MRTQPYFSDKSKSLNNNLRLLLIFEGVGTLILHESYIYQSFLLYVSKFQTHVSPPPPSPTHSHRPPHTSEVERVAGGALRRLAALLRCLIPLNSKYLFSLLSDFMWVSILFVERFLFFLLTDLIEFEWKLD